MTRDPPSRDLAIDRSRGSGKREFHIEAFRPRAPSPRTPSAVTISAKSRIAACETGRPPRRRPRPFSVSIEQQACRGDRELCCRRTVPRSSRGLLWFTALRPKLLGEKTLECANRHGRSILPRRHASSHGARTRVRLSKRSDWANRDARYASASRPFRDQLT